MLRFESIFWSSPQKDQLKSKFESLGFRIYPSRREATAEAIYFGPEALELTSSGSNGIEAIDLETDDIARDYKRFLGMGGKLERPTIAKSLEDNVPVWTSFNVPDSLTPLLKGRVIMNSPYELKWQSEQQLPLSHPNTCFGIEAIHILAADPGIAANHWSNVVEKNVSGLQWNELFQRSGKRIQTGDRFFDVLTKDKEREGVFMVTLKVTDLEHAYHLAEKAGAKPQPCATRDGFVVLSDFTGGPALRFARSFWKKYLPAINENYPFGRRTDLFRPLGGANSSTLEDGFKDNWNY